MRESLGFWGQLLLPTIHSKAPVVWGPVQATSTGPGALCQPPAPVWGSPSLLLPPYQSRRPLTLVEHLENRKVWLRELFGPWTQCLNVFLFSSYPVSRKNDTMYFSKEQIYSIRWNHFFPAKPPTGFPSQLSAAHKIKTVAIYPPSSKSITAWLWTNGQVVLPNRAWMSSFFPSWTEGGGLAQDLFY